MTDGTSASTVRKILSFQALIVLLVPSAILLVGKEWEAFSAMLGGLVALIPSLYFALRMHLAKEQEAKRIVRSFYVSETHKIILTAVLFILVFQIPGVNLIMLLLAYAAVLSVYWFALFF